MTDNRALTFTIKQIKDIYRAGIRRGNDEQSAHNWGSFPSGKEYDECVEAVYDIINEGIEWGEPKYINFKDVEAWFK